MSAQERSTSPGRAEAVGVDVGVEKLVEGLDQLVERVGLPAGDVEDATGRALNVRGKDVCR
jgi:hypothetical protein